MTPRAAGELGLYSKKAPNHCILFKALHELQKSVSYLIYPIETLLNLRFTCAGWLVPCLVGNIKETFSHNRAQILNDDQKFYFGISCYGISLRYTMVVHVYVAIMHECQRVHYRTYTCTNHGISDLYHYNQPMSSYS